MPISTKHRNALEIMERLLKKNGCACVRHGNVGGIEPDLACACEEPITLVEVETDESINKKHTNHQMAIMQQYTKNNEARAAVIVTDGKNLCGIAINEEGGQILEENDIRQCSPINSNSTLPQRHGVWRSSKRSSFPHPRVQGYDIFGRCPINRRPGLKGNF